MGIIVAFALLIWFAVAIVLALFYGRMVSLRDARNDGRRPPSGEILRFDRKRKATK